LEFVKVLEQDEEDGSLVEVEYPEEPSWTCTICGKEAKSKGLGSNAGQGSSMTILSSHESPLKGLAYPYIDDNVLRIWGLRRYEVGGVEVIGWEVGMEPA
jgi:hypothetical protein